MRKWDREQTKRGSLVDKGGKKSKKRKGETNRRGRERETKKGSTSLYDLRKSDCRFSSKQKVKSVHASRATRGYQNLGVSSNSKR